MSHLFFIQNSGTENLAGGVYASSPTQKIAQTSAGSTLESLADRAFENPPNCCDTSTDISVLDTNCIDITFSDEGLLSADPILSPDAGNALECRTNGLYASVSGALPSGSVSELGLISAIPASVPSVASKDFYWEYAVPATGVDFDGLPAPLTNLKPTDVVVFVNDGTGDISWTHPNTSRVYLFGPGDVLTLQWTGTKYLLR